jgi:hypothetical protein
MKGSENGKMSSTTRRIKVNLDFSNPRSNVVNYPDLLKAHISGKKTAPKVSSTIASTSTQSQTNKPSHEQPTSSAANHAASSIFTTDPTAPVAEGSDVIMADSSVPSGLSIPIVANEVQREVGDKGEDEEQEEDDDESDDAESEADGTQPKKRVNNGTNSVIIL